MSSASAVGRPATSATRTAAPETWSGKSRPGCSESVVTISSPDRARVPTTTMLHAVGRRAGERDAVRRRADQGCQLLADRGAQCEHALEPRLAASPLALVEAQALLRRSERGNVTAGRACPRSDTRSARAPGTRRGPPRRSCDLPFDRRVIREHLAVEQAPFFRPDARRRPLRAREREHGRSRSESGRRTPTPARSDRPASGSCAR